MTDAERRAEVLKEIYRLEVEEWENELDMLGSNAGIKKYLYMLESAPLHAPSATALAAHIQNLSSK